MGLFEKLGLVEKIPNENTYSNYDDCQESSKIEMQWEDQAKAEVSEVNQDTLIEDIYSQNDLCDRTKSIFKVEDLINSLPKEMVTETKRNSVTAILESFQLTSMDIIDDGKKRINVLSCLMKQLEQATQQEIETKNAHIESLKEEIACMQAEIVKQQEIITISTRVITSEINRIQSLVNFVNGGINL